MSIDVNWWQVVPIGANWRQLVPIGGDWCYLVPIGVNWCQLVSMGVNGQGPHPPHDFNFLSDLSLRLMWKIKFWDQPAQPSQAGQPSQECGGRKIPQI